MPRELRCSLAGFLTERLQPAYAPDDEGRKRWPYLTRTSSLHHFELRGPGSLVCRNEHGRGALNRAWLALIFVLVLVLLFYSET